MDTQELFRKIYEIGSELEHQMNQDTDPIEWQQRLEESEDALYKEYCHLIHDNFDRELLAEVEKRVGYGMFCTYDYYIALEEEYNRRPRVIDEYRGYTLKRCLDCFGCTSYFVYKNGRQQVDGLDYFSDDSARRGFRAAIDDNKNDPYFEL